MIVQAEISLYPLKRAGLARPIAEFVGHLRRRALEVETGPMSSIVTGESQTVFTALREAFDAAARQGPVVLCIKVSNACPRDTQEAAQ